MRRYWSMLFGLDRESSIWVEEDELGKDKDFFHRNKRYCVKIPQKINRKITLRLKGLGRTRGDETGSLLLHVWLNRGEDVRNNLWLSETSARQGTSKTLLIGAKKITMTIPPNSCNGLTMRLRGLGKESSFDNRAPFLANKKRGNALVKLFVYPDSITPNCSSFENLSTDNMVLEGWVYRKLDEVLHKIGESSFFVKPLQAHVVADLFNERGWRSIFHAIVEHLNLAHLNVQLAKSDSISEPGNCQIFVHTQNNIPVACDYRITINEQFLDNPFSIAAILAHELCHVVYFEKIDGTLESAGIRIRSENATLEQERTVDLLVFMFQIGEFQLRVARDKRFTFGYFNQEVFERIQAIVSRGLYSR